MFPPPKIPKEKNKKEVFSRPKQNVEKAWQQKNT